jgi:uncharacterized protein
LMKGMLSYLQAPRLATVCTVLAALLATMAFAGTVAAGPFEEAAAAYNRRDYSTALKLYRPLADAGKPLAQYRLGVMYDKGLGVPKDPAEALTWYRKAADQGVAAARYSLGSIYATSQGVSQDYVKAMTWFRAAADQGFAAAQYGVGYMYFKGYGVQQDYGEALRWFRKAAEQGDADAQYGLGSMYSRGEGISRNSVEALKWFNLAIAGLRGKRRDTAVLFRDLEANKMTPQQVAEAEKLGREWQPMKLSQPDQQAAIPTTPGYPSSP